MDYRPRSKTTHIIVHDSHTPTDLPSAEHYLRWLGRVKGLLDIGYHAVIDRDGSIIETRAWDSIGSHAPGYNHVSVGLCLFGGADPTGQRAENNFTPNQMAVLQDTIAMLTTRYGPLQVVGHTELQRVKYRKGAFSRCPCIDMAALRACLPAHILKDPE
jgi:N-acetylmuramoyl-L-alanine amidase